MTTIAYISHANEREIFTYPTSDLDAAIKELKALYGFKRIDTVVIEGATAEDFGFSLKEGWEKEI